MLVNLIKQPGCGQVHLEGYARLSRIRALRNQDRLVSGLTLEDASGETDRVIVQSEPARLEALLMSGIVKLRLQLPQHATDRYVRVTQIRAAVSDEIFNAAALLPRVNCPAPALPALEQLIAFNATITNHCLRRFLNAVLLDPAISLPLLCATASRGYHHAEPGGLLIHSTELLPEAARLADAAFPDNPDAVTLIQLGYLLHDIGKVVTHGPSADRLAKRHEQVTLELLAPHLCRLATTAPALAQALRLVFEHCLIPSRQRGIASFLGADIVIWCDQLSTARNHGSTWARLLATPAMNDANVQTGVRHHG